MSTDDILTPPEAEPVRPQPLYEEWVSPQRRAFVPVESAHNYATAPGWWRLPWQGTLDQVHARGFRPASRKPSPPKVAVAE